MLKKSAGLGEGRSPPICQSLRNVVNVVVVGGASLLDMMRAVERLHHRTLYGFVSIQSGWLGGAVPPSAHRRGTCQLLMRYHYIRHDTADMGSCLIGPGFGGRSPPTGKPLRHVAVVDKETLLSFLHPSFFPCSVFSSLLS